MTTRCRILQSLVLGIQFIAISSCGTLDRKRATEANDASVSFEEPQPPQTFLEIYHDLKKTSAYRQNIWLTWNNELDTSQIALCVDLRNQVYLVIRATPTVRSRAELPNYYQNLAVSVQTLRARMDPEAFVLNGTNPPIVGIFQIPNDAPESFAADAINQLLGQHVTPERLTFQAD